MSVVLKDDVQYFDDQVNALMDIYSKDINDDFCLNVNRMMSWMNCI